MKLYNTLSRQLEEFKPLSDKTVTIYSCGPTVYDHMHIGNLGAFINTDTLRCVLKAQGFKVKHTMNITDVEDKIILRSTEQYPDYEPLIALKNLTQKYTEIFFSDLRKVGFDIKAVNFVKATDSINDIQTIIKALYDKKFAYIAEDGIYFSIKAYKAAGKKYGQLSDITVDSTSHARIRNDEYNKESAHDFALWKLKTDNEPAWEFNLDGHQLLGRPGWHIECSAMSVKSLGQPFDIHTGGVDLIFPHHENEIAQSTATDGDFYAKYFVHNEHLLVDGRKMSKSLNNFFTLQDILEKGFEPLAFRLWTLQSHYRSQSNFSWENLTAAQNKLKDFRAWSEIQLQSKKSEQLARSYTEALKAIENEMSNDLNTPAALALINGLISRVDELGPDSEAIAHASLKLDELFGLGLSTPENIDVKSQEMFDSREKARAEKNWAKADELRMLLEEQGIGLKDSADGTIWYRL